MNNEAFNIRQISALTSDTLYRVYLEKDAAYFVKLGGQGGTARSIGRQFGLLGLWLASIYEKKQAGKIEDLAAGYDRLFPAELMAKDKSNFCLRYIEIESATVEPAPFFGGHGAHVGRLSLVQRGGKKRLFQFEDAMTMRLSLEKLESTLRGKLTWKARWDDAKGQLVKA